MFYVFDNNKPAILSKVLTSPFTKHDFKTFEEALKYARFWLGPIFDSDGETGIELELNVPYDYSGYGDFIEIRDSDDYEQEEKPNYCKI